MANRIKANTWLILVLGGAALQLAGCQSDPSAAYREAKISIAHGKAGVTTPNDPEQLLAISAKGARSKADIQKFNREYGKFLLEKGKRRQAYQVLETAALAGDQSSQNRLVQGQLNGHYRPANMSKIAREVYMPAALSGSSVSANILMAELVGKGRVRGAAFKSESFWLQRAAGNGSTRASRELAEKAERSGNIGLAANYYAKSDRISKSERALRQARIYYLGQGVRQNAKIAHAWMERARRMNKKAAGELAARVYRTTGGSLDGSYLQTIASAAGVNSTLSVGRISRDYRAAKTDAERRSVIAPLERSADNGNADAALVVANLYIRTGGSDDKISKYLGKAYAGGKAEALELMITRLKRARPGSASANSLYNAVASAANKGSVKAARALASIYSIGGAKPASVAESRKWLRKAANAGDTKSQYELGVDLFENGNGGSDQTAAVKYLEMAAASGDPFAASYLKTKQ